MRRSPTTIDSISAEERRSSLRTLRKVVPYLWPADQKSVKYRVVLAMLV